MRIVVNPTQAGIPVEVTAREIEREKTLGGAISLCAKAAGFELDKELQRELGVDKAQFSRWLSGQEGIVWPKLIQLMTVCGNDAPVLWMLYQLGYDLASLRKRETETERKLREAMEEIESLRNERDVTMRVLREIKAAA
jgi:plasmid maintenance system antidote protein VapI